MRKNIKLVLSQKSYIFIYIITFFAFLTPGLLFFNYKTSLGNLGREITYLELLMHTIVSLLFALFLTGRIYKVKVIGSNKGSKTEGIIGGIFGILLVGCPSCGMGLIAYMGLAGFLSRIPKFGITLEIISLILLSLANYSMYKNLLYCKIKKTT